MKGGGGISVVFVFCFLRLAAASAAGWRGFSVGIGLGRMTVSPRCQFLVATPSGRGAIAVLLVRGTQAREVVQSFFQSKSGKSLLEASEHAVLYGSIQGEDGLVCPTKDGVEIHCHGSAAAVRRISRLLEEQGAQAISAAEDLEQRLENPRERRILELLPEAVTWKTARILLEQRKLARLGRLPGEDAQRWLGVAEHLTVPWRVVLAGEPNVGKSALFNAILGFSRAMVCEQAGTTRDLLRERTVLDGWLVEFTDTAGLRENAPEIEAAGIQQAQSMLEHADLVLHVRDAFQEKDSGNPSENVDALGRQVLTVWNKLDLLSEDEKQAISPEAVGVSAKTGEGMERLLAEIVRRLVPEEPTKETVLPIA